MTSSCHDRATQKDLWHFKRDLSQEIVWVYFRGFLLIWNKQSPKSPPPPRKRQTLHLVVAQTRATAHRHKRPTNHEKRCTTSSCHDSVVLSPQKKPWLVKRDVWHQKRPRTDQKRYTTCDKRYMTSCCRDRVIKQDLFHMKRDICLIKRDIWLIKRDLWLVKRDLWLVKRDIWRHLAVIE